MRNVQGRPHGGVIFSLADIAFGAACNSHGVPAVALSMTIGFLSPAAPGTRLLAEAREQQQGRRAGFHEVVVTDAHGALVATVHCVAHRIGGAPPGPAPPGAGLRAPGGPPGPTGTR